jgi:hypothetical protein
MEEGQIPIHINGECFCHSLFLCFATRVFSSNPLRGLVGSPSGHPPVQILVVPRICGCSRAGADAPAMVLLFFNVNLLKFFQREINDSFAFDKCVLYKNPFTSSVFQLESTYTPSSRASRLPIGIRKPELRN